MLWAGLLAPISTVPALAHEGHEHAPQTARSSTESASPLEGARFSAQSGAFETVVVNQPPEIVVYVDALVTNEPVAGAVVEFESGGAILHAQERRPGLYVVQQALPAGKHRVDLRITYDGYEQRVSGDIEVAQPPASPRSRGGGLAWIKGGALAGMGFGLAMLAFWSGKRRAGGALLLGVMAVLLLVTRAVGHDGPHPATGEEPPASAETSKSSLPVTDETGPPLNVSKATQRLIGILTIRARAEMIQDTVELAGRVIADSNGMGRAQAERDGRVEPPESGFLHVGQRVEKGALLGYLVPTLTTSEESNLQQTLAQIERDSALLVTKSDSVGIVNPNMPMTEASASLLQELQIQAESLRRQKEAVLAALQKKIAINAPIAGVISKTDLAAGQMVGARETLVEIVDPNRKLLEAFGFGNIAAEQIADATAQYGEDHRVELALVGTGPVLKQLATPVLFRPREGASQIEIGTPMRVLMRLKRQRTGIVVPREALTRDESGRWVIWEHTQPEAFVAHPVTPVPVDAGHVLVTGLAENARIVVSGAGLLGQAR